MNPDPPTKAMAPRGDQTGWLKQLLHGAERDARRQRGSNPYRDAVAGSADPTRRRRALGVGGPGFVRRWRAEDGSLHRTKKTAGQRPVLVTVET
jgi:hypothetical protein